MIQPNPGILGGGFPGGSDSKESACKAGDPGSVPGLGRSPGGGNGNSPVFLPGKFCEQGSLEGYCLWGFKELDITEHIHKVWETCEWRTKRFDVTSIKK